MGLYIFPKGKYEGKYLTVSDAISDLPPLSNNESSTNYLSSPKNDYQKLMRGKGYIKAIASSKILQNHTAPNHPQETIDKIADAGEYNCLCIVRGGGPQESLNVFNDQEVVDSLTKVRETMYIVTGIGHSDDLTECDEVADYCAYTPTDAAYFLNRSVLALFHV